MKSAIVLVYVVLVQLLRAQSSMGLPGEILSDIDTSALLKNSSISIYAVNTASGEPKLNYFGHKVLAPASNLKVVTSAVALEKLGGGYSFSTRYYIYGKKNSAGVLEGGIHIVPSGDPTLASTFIDSVLTYQSILDTLVLLLKAEGITGMQLAPSIDMSKYSVQSTPDYWPYIDIGNYYGAGINKFTVFDNMYYLYFTPGMQPGDDATVHRLDPPGDYLSFINHMKTGKPGSGDNGYIYPLGGRKELLLQGTIPANVEEFGIRGTMPDPAETFCVLLKSKLDSAGIYIAGSEKYLPVYDSLPPRGSRLIFEITSPPLSKIVKIINKRSINLYTEQVLAAVGSEMGEASTDNGLAVIKDFYRIKNLHSDGMRLGDGSGLSRTNMISAQSITSILSYMTGSRYFGAYYDSFPVAGDTTDMGGFKRFGLGTPIAMNARIKSGTINGVRAFSGYIDNKKGERLAFSFLVNNYNGRSAAVDTFFKQLLMELYNSN